METYSLHFWVDPNERNDQNQEEYINVTADQYNKANSFANGETNYKGNHTLYINKKEYMKSVMDLISL